MGAAAGVPAQGDVSESEFESLAGELYSAVIFNKLKNVESGCIPRDVLAQFISGLVDVLFINPVDENKQSFSSDVRLDQIEAILQGKGLSSKVAPVRYDVASGPHSILLEDSIDQAVSVIILLTEGFVTAARQAESLTWLQYAMRSKSKYRVFILTVDTVSADVMTWPMPLKEILDDVFISDGSDAVRTVSNMHQLVNTMKQRVQSTVEERFFQPTSPITLATESTSQRTTHPRSPGLGKYAVSESGGDEEDDVTIPLHGINPTPSKTISSDVSTATSTTDAHRSKAISEKISSRSREDDGSGTVQEGRDAVSKAAIYLVTKSGRHTSTHNVQGMPEAVVLTTEQIEEDTKALAELQLLRDQGLSPLELYETHDYTLRSLANVYPLTDIAASIDDLQLLRAEFTLNELLAPETGITLEYRRVRQVEVDRGLRHAQPVSSGKYAASSQIFHAVDEVDNADVDATNEVANHSRERSAADLVAYICDDSNVVILLDALSSPAAAPTVQSSQYVPPAARENFLLNSLLALREPTSSQSHHHKSNKHLLASSAGKFGKLNLCQLTSSSSGASSSMMSPGRRPPAGVNVEAESVLDFGYPIYQVTRMIQLANGRLLSGCDVGAHAELRLWQLSCNYKTVTIASPNAGYRSLDSPRPLGEAISSSWQSLSVPSAIHTGSLSAGNTPHVVPSMSNLAAVNLAGSRLMSLATTKTSSSTPSSATHHSRSGATPGLSLGNQSPQRLAAQQHLAGANSPGGQQRSSLQIPDKTPQQPAVQVVHHPLPIPVAHTTGSVTVATDWVAKCVSTVVNSPVDSLAELHDGRIVVASGAALHILSTSDNTAAGGEENHSSNEVVISIVGTLRHPRSLHHAILKRHNSSSRRNSFNSPADANTNQQMSAAAQSALDPLENLPAVLSASSASFRRRMQQHQHDFEGSDTGSEDEGNSEWSDMPHFMTNKMRKKSFDGQSSVVHGQVPPSVETAVLLKNVMGLVATGQLLAIQDAALAVFDIQSLPSTVCDSSGVSSHQTVDATVAGKLGQLHILLANVLLVHELGMGYVALAHGPAANTASSENAASTSASSASATGVGSGSNADFAVTLRNAHVSWDQVIAVLYGHTAPVTSIAHQRRQLSGHVAEDKAPAKQQQQRSRRVVKRSSTSSGQHAQLTENVSVCWTLVTGDESGVLRVWEYATSIHASAAHHHRSRRGSRSNDIHAQTTHHHNNHHLNSHSHHHVPSDPVSVRVLFTLDTRCRCSILQVWGVGLAGRWVSVADDVIHVWEEVLVIPRL